MRLLDEDSDRALTKIAVYLTAEEADELQKAIDRVRSHAKGGRPEHIHVDDREYAHHLTLVLYSPDRLGEFQPRYRRLILEDR